jgi:hypothetical protein
MPEINHQQFLEQQTAERERLKQRLIAATQQRRADADYQEMMANISATALSDYCRHHEQIL